MPQMSPMEWLYLYILFSLINVFIINKTFFSMISQSNQINSNKLPTLKTSSQWLW